MIKSISFENYKSFKDATTLDIKPITILVGPNSSGKSSIIKLFGLISQSYNEGNPNSQLLYKGKDCDLGDFKTMSHNNLKEPIHIGFKMDAYSQDDNLKSYMKEAGEYELSIDIENNSEITKHSYKEENDDNSQISELFSIYKDDRGNHLLKTKEPLGDIISHFDKELKVLKKILKIGFGKSYTNNDIRGIGEQIYDRVNRANVKIRGLKVLEIDPFELPDAQPREFVWKVLNQPDPTVGMPRGVLYFLQQFKNHDSCFITTALGF